MKRPFKLKELKEAIHCSYALNWYPDFDTNTGKHMTPTKFKVIVRTIIQVLHWFFISPILEFACLKIYRSHKWVDCSEIGPDSGQESGYCERCGYSFYHRYY